MNTTYSIWALSSLLKSHLSKKSAHTHQVESLSLEFLLSLPSQHFIFDIDDTLVPEGEPLNQSALDLLYQLSLQRDVALLSNGSESRMKKHAKALSDFPKKIHLFPRGFKPNFKLLNSELKKLNWAASDCAMIGDRLSMDMWMAKKSGLKIRVWVRAFRSRKPLTLLDKIKRLEDLLK